MSEATLSGGLRATARGRAAQIWRAWEDSGARLAAQALVTAAAGLLFLHAAATVEVVYTVRISNILLLLACVIGAPFVVQGWRRVPPSICWSAAGLFAAYAVATLFGETMILESVERSADHRSLAYLADLGLGLATIGLVAGAWSRPNQLRGVFWALFAGAVVVSGYGIYQWFAQRYGLPLEDVNNAVNSDGVTRGGGRSQGYGVLGGERIKGTFVEPHFMAMFLASTLPFALVLVGTPRRWLYLGQGAVALIAVALVLTTSAPAWTALALATLVGLALAAVSRGYVGLAATCGAVVVIAMVAGAFALSQPESLSFATGRTGSELATTTKFRTETWDRVIDIWSTRPVIGFGPGQGPVRLATRVPLPGRPLVLGTAEGLWSAALLDGGVVALSCWLLFLGVMLYQGGRAVLRRGGPMALATFVAATAAVLGSLVGGDRLDLRVWLVLGLLAAVCSAPQSNRRQSNGQSAERAA